MVCLLLLIGIDHISQNSESEVKDDSIDMFLAPAVLGAFLCVLLNYYFYRVAIKYYNLSHSYDNLDSFIDNESQISKRIMW